MLDYEQQLFDAAMTTVSELDQTLMNLIEHLKDYSHGDTLENIQESLGVSSELLEVTLYKFEGLELGYVDSRDGEWGAFLYS